jgi:sigma-B regulation protein RsbU (phosphoserine phosphatase)
VILGVIFFTGFAIAFGLRIPLEQRFVDSAAVALRPRRQFVMEGVLCILVGVGILLFNRLVLQFPVANGLVVVFGSLMAGFFIATDMGLARERMAILEAMQRQDRLKPPERLYPMSRKFSAIALTTALFVAVVIGMVVSHDIAWLRQVENSQAALAEAGMAVLYEIFFIMGVLLIWIVNLIVSYSSNLNLLFDSETSVLENVSRGDFSRMVPVATNDEFGFIAGHTNSMIDGLKHRIELVTALKMAEEVQQSLLPQKPPAVPGLDISGQSIYCDETGGDYFDYFDLPGNRLGVVVADAADHGIGAALHMATARAFLLYSLQSYTDPAALLNAVNPFLTRDGADTGRFTALFLLEIDPGAHTLRWVRAGHDPAWIYDSQSGRFQELSGKGMALGVDAGQQYVENVLNHWSPGSIIVIATDGIREARNPAGDMFGLERFQRAIRDNAAASAEAIKLALLDDLGTFRGNAPQDDDITLVVIKLLAGPQDG